MRLSFKEDRINRINSALDQCKRQFLPFSFEYKRSQLYRDRFMFTLPEPYAIGTTRELKKIGESIVEENNKQVYGQQGSLKVSLKLLFASPGLFEVTKEYMKQFEKEKKIMSNFIQCQTWQIIKKASTNKFVIPIL